MKLTSIKKEVVFRMNNLNHPQAMASKFLLSPNDQDMVERINLNDESALLQFTFKHINILTGWIIQNGLNAGQEHRLMDLCLPVFADQIKVFAAKHKDKILPENWDLKFIKLYGQQFYNFSFALADEKLQTWKNFEITNQHIVFLNQLNAFLSKTEAEIIAQAKKEIPLLEHKLKDTAVQTSDYEYFIDIDFFTKDTDGNPVYTAYHSFHISNVQDQNWRLLGDEEDWRESGWLPPLENRCCYLMHELVYHSHIRQSIFDIDKIWINIKVWDQGMFSCKDEEWENQKFSI